MMVFFEVLPHLCILVAAFVRPSKLIQEMASYFVYQIDKHCNLVNDQQELVSLLSYPSSSFSSFIEDDNVQASYARFR